MRGAAYADRVRWRLSGGAAWLACALLLTAAWPLDAQPSDEPREAAAGAAGDTGASEDETATPPGPERRERTKSRSVRRTNHGWLQHGVRLSSDHIQVRHPSNAYGTQELVDLLTWAAAEVAREHPGSMMNAGDLSRRRGGRLRPHRSHRAGRDADIGFYLRDNSGGMATPRWFVPLMRSGKGGRNGEAFFFDDARNWTFVAALMGQDVVPVQYVMVIAPLKERLLAEGRRRGAAPELLHRVEEAVGPRRTGRGRFARYGTHDSHFHIRVYCAADDIPRCQDQPPYWDWYTRPTPPPRASSMRRRGRSSMRSMRPSMRVSMRSSMRSMRSSMRSRMR